MRSSDVTAGNTIYASDVNKIRDDAFASSWLLAHEQTSPDLTLKVENGVYYLNGKRIDFAGGNSPSFTAPVTNPRIDILSIDLSGTLIRTAGTEAISPVAPTEPINSILIAQVYNRVGQTSIKDTDDSTNGYIQKDIRPFIQNKTNEYLKFTAEMDLTAGDPAGVSIDRDSKIAKALYTKITTSNITASGSFKIFRPDSLVWLNDDLFICVFVSNTGTNGFSVVAGTVDRDTMQINFGSDVSVSVAEGYESAKAVKVTTNTFSIYYVEDGTNQLNIKTYSVSGTTITIQNTTFTGLGGGIVRVDAIQIATNEVVFFNGSYGGGNLRRVGYVTYSGYVPTVVDTDDTFGVANWSYGAKMCKIDTNKVVMISTNSSSSQNKVLCFTTSGSVITMGAELSISVTAVGDVPIHLNTNIVAYSTTRVLVRSNQNSATNVYFAVIGVSGTTCSVLTTLLNDGVGGSQGSLSGKMILQSSSGKIIEYQNDFTSTKSGLYQITPSDSGIVRKLISNGIDFSPENEVVLMEYNTTNDYYIIIAGVSQLYGNIFIQGLSNTFLGFVQSTVNRGDDVYIRRDGDNHQTGLIAGANYEVSNGSLVETFDTTNTNAIVAKSATEVLR